ncbi:MAG: hypothetical protein MJZ04_08855, partial [Bacteroidales bacterium]|nr:hypothetical protein [Bacteroidales bacterium]
CCSGREHQNARCEHPRDPSAASGPHDSIYGQSSELSNIDMIMPLFMSNHIKVLLIDTQMAFFMSKMPGLPVPLASGTTV